MIFMGVGLFFVTEKRFNRDKIYMCMYICIHIYICVYSCIYICIYTHVYINIRLATNGFKYKPSLLLNIFLFLIPWTFSSIISQVSIYFLLNFLSCPIYLKKKTTTVTPKALFTYLSILSFFFPLPFPAALLPLFCGQYWE